MTSAQRIRQAERLYEERLKDDLESRHAGEIVAIDIKSGEYYLGRNPIEAISRGRLEHPNVLFACLRIGGGPVYRVGRV